MHFDGSEKTFFLKTQTRINERDTMVQGPGFGPGFDHGLNIFSKT